MLLSFNITRYYTKSKSAEKPAVYMAVYLISPKPAEKPAVL
jgi:hypothetical protein